MVICFIALIVFAVLGIFSATHRVIAKEAFECVFLKATLRPCKSNLDKRLKSQITGKFLRRSPKAGRFVYKHFELISWIFTIIMILSMISSTVSIYNYAVYGNCEGEDSTEACIYNQIGDIVTGNSGGEHPENCELPQPIIGIVNSGGTGDN
jgi:hypothetical protein